MNSQTLAVIVLSEDICGGLIGNQDINGLISKLGSINDRQLSIFVASNKKNCSMLQSVNAEVTIYKNHPVETLFSPIIQSYDHILVLAGNQQINDSYVADMLSSCDQQIIAAVQSQLNSIVQGSQSQAYYPLPTWRNIGSVSPYLEHGGFIIKSEVVKKFNISDLGRLPNWLSLSTLILKSGYAIYYSQKTRLIENQCYFSFPGMLVNICRIAYSVVPVQISPTKSPKKDYSLSRFYKLDCGRHILARLVCNNFSFVILAIISFTSTVISVAACIYKLLPNESIITKFSNQIEKSVVCDGITYKFNPSYWVLFEDDRVRIGLWSGGDNVVARSTAGLFLKSIFGGIDNFDKIVSIIASEYKQSINIVEQDLSKYFKALIKDNIFIGQ